MAASRALLVVGVGSPAMATLGVFIFDNRASVALYFAAATVAAFSAGFFYPERSRQLGKCKTFLGERPLDDSGPT